MRSKIIVFLLIILFPLLLISTTGKVEKQFELNFEKPTGLTYDGKAFWITDRYEAKIYKVNKDNGKIVSSFNSPGPWPIGIGCDGDLLWVGDKADRQIYLISKDGKKIYKSLSLPVRTPSGISVKNDGIWVATERENKIVKISKMDGSILDEFEAPSYLNGIDIKENGDFFATSRIKDRIYRGSIKTKLFYFYFPAPGKYSWGIFYDGNNLWNIDQADKKLYKILYSDEDKWIKGESKNRIIKYRNGIYNYGPGIIKNLKIYVALPENKYNQDIESIDYSLKPKEILKDKTDQKYAYFLVDEVKPGDRIRIITTYKFSHQEVQAMLTPEKVKGEIPEKIKKIYLNDDERYDIKDPYIEKVVNKTKGIDNLYLRAYKLYRYVGDRIEYKLYGGWEPAPIVLKRGSGSCSEYTFSYVALLRKAGIPARYVGAISRRGDDIGYDDVYHRWVEVYFPGFGWIPVDPNAGDSKDVDRQLFFFGGTSPRYIITTRHSGPSPFLGWDYNSKMQWESEGKVKLYTDKVAEWYLPEK